MSQAKTRKAAPVYSDEKANAARAGRYYIKLGDKRGQLLLSGAVQKWKADPTFVYVPSLRVAGNPAEILRILGELGYPAADVQAHINAGYRAGSEAAAEFVAELADLKANKAKAVKKTAATAALPNTIAYYSEQVDQATVTTKEGGSPRKRSASPKRKSTRKAAGTKKAKTARKTRSKSASPKARKTRSKSASPKKRASPKGKRAPKDLSEKIANLSEGKYMDVSKLHVDGSGAKTVAAPGPKSKKVVIHGTRIVSDNKRGVNAAAKLLGDESLAGRWVASSKGGAHTSPAATVAMSPSASSPGGIALPPLPRASSPRGRLPPVKTIGSPTTSPRL